MAGIKTTPTEVAAEAFIAAVADPVRRADARMVAATMARLSGEPARMWGPSIVGFGSYDYRYDSGRTGTMCRIGFSPRKAELVLYILTGAAREAAQLARLGRHRTGKSCLYIRRLADVDIGVLEEMIGDALAAMNAHYPSARSACSPASM